MEVLYGGQLHTDTETAITIGNFDGLHLGHAKLLSSLKGYAEANNLQSLVYTFSEHPSKIFNGNISAITNLEEKTRLIEKYQPDILYYAAFSEVKDLSPDAFVKDVLCDQLHMKMAVIGENNRFGKHAKGDAALLCALGKQLGFSVHVIKSVIADGVVCSSSEIRRRITAGDMEGASRLLGRRFSIKGIVISGKQLGRVYGFPTANFAPNPDALLPKCGVYATNTRVGNCIYPSITNVGETSFDQKKILRIETHLLDFSGDLYGLEIEVEFLYYMRDILPFQALDDLQQQLKKDRETRRKDTEEFI